MPAARKSEYDTLTRACILPVEVLPHPLFHRCAHVLDLDRITTYAQDSVRKTLDSHLVLGFPDQLGSPHARDSMARLYMFMSNW
jgi:hypothetical protein